MSFVIMQLHLYTITTLLIVLEGIDSLANQLDTEAMDVTFRQRSRSDWENVWHQESHMRCRDKLVRHLFWACDKDIYRLERRSGRVGGAARVDDQHAVEKQDYGGFPWVDRDTATQMLRTRRGRRRVASGGAAHSQGSGSITAECCTRTGCTWEEYAEYCPANNRAV